jgi:DNA-binding response OmpR family regulator
MPQTVVLAVGRDSLLLRTREQVLQAARYTVVSTHSLKDAMAKFLHGDFDLVILCHSLPVEERERLTYLIREQTTLTPIISISSNLGQHDLFTDVTLDNDPNEHITGLREVLNGHGEYFREDGSTDRAA